MSKFTKEQIATIVGTYEADAIGQDYDARTAVVADLADEFKVTVPVIRGVLVAEGVYVKKEAATGKVAVAKVNKGEIVGAFEAAFGIKLPSMDKMTGKDLVVFWDRFVEMSEVRNANEGK